MRSAGALVYYLAVEQSILPSAHERKRYLLWVLVFISSTLLTIWLLFSYVAPAALPAVHVSLEEWEGLLQRNKNYIPPFALVRALSGLGSYVSMERDNLKLLFQSGSSRRRPLRDVKSHSGAPATQNVPGAGSSQLLLGVLAGTASLAAIIASWIGAGALGKPVQGCVERDQWQMCVPAAVKIVGRRQRWELWHIRIGVVIEKPRGCVVVDERVVDEPVDRAALGAGLAEGVPRGQQVRILLVQHVFETTKGALALNGSRQPASGSVIAGPLGEVGHVLVPDVGREGVDADQIQVIEVDGCLAVDTGVGSPEHDLPGLGIDQPAMLVVGLVGKSGSDLL